MRRWLFLALALFACETKDQRAPESAMPAVGGTRASPVDKAAESVRRAQDEFVTGAQRRLDDVVRRSEQLGAEASAQLAEKRKQTEALLRDARDQAGAKWEQAKGNIDRALADLEAEIERLRQGVAGSDGG
jgi:hypothetical protein